MKRKKPKLRKAKKVKPFRFNYPKSRILKQSEFLERKQLLENLANGLNQTEGLLKAQFHRLNAAQERIVSFILSTGADPFKNSLPVVPCYPTEDLRKEFSSIKRKLTLIGKQLFINDDSA